MFGPLATTKRITHRAPHWLAIAAMVINFVASYGHLHPEDFDFLTHGHGKLTLSADHGTGRALGDPLAADTDCPICTAMSLLGSSALPGGVHIVPPLAHYLAVIVALETLWLTPPRHLLFETRGPPLS